MKATKRSAIISALSAAFLFVAMLLAQPAAPQSTVTSSSIVSGVPTLTFPAYTFATLPNVAASAGAVARVSNVGPTGAGSLWISNGTRWWPLNGTVGLYTLAARSSNIATTETVVAQYLIPAGVFQVGDRIRVSLSMTKSGTTDIGTLTFRFGTAGTTADTSMGGGTLLVAGNRSAQVIQDFRLLTTTSLQRLTGTVAGSQGYLGPATSAFTSAVAVSDTSTTAQYLTITINSGGATDTVNLEDAHYELMTGN